VALSDITSVFSRYFIVGFFLPAYASLVALWLTASSALTPNTLERRSQATQVLILGGAALVAGLALSGLSYYITRLYEGYGLERARDVRGFRSIHRAAVALQKRRYNKLLEIRQNKAAVPRRRSSAAWFLEKWYPQDPCDLLPTRVGNAIRAFEQHSNARWGLDGVTIWPRIEALLSADERELEVDAKVNFYVFINASLGAYVVGVSLIVDAAIHKSPTAWHWSLYAIPFLVGYLSYRAAIGPAVDWGDSVRASVDLHRLDLYEKLGVRAPTSFSDEREIADKVNKALLYAHPLLPDDLWRSEAADSTTNQVQSTDPGLLMRLWASIAGGG